MASAEIRPVVRPAREGSSLSGIRRPRVRVCRDHSDRREGWSRGVNVAEPGHNIGKLVPRPSGAGVGAGSGIDCLRCHAGTASPPAGSYRPRRNALDGLDSTHGQGGHRGASPVANHALRRTRDPRPFTMAARAGGAGRTRRVRSRLVGSSILRLGRGVDSVLDGDDRIRTRSAGGGPP